MHLTHLSLTNFRSFARLDLDMPRRILLLVGDNAQGKTSLLEAVYYLSTFTSFHALNDRQLINFVVSEDQLSAARIVADYIRLNERHRLEVRIIQEPGGNGSLRLRKEIFLDGVKRTTHEALGNFIAVIFLPQMMRIIEGSPEERRRYLNLVLSQAIPGYALALSEYQQALTQRNALLKLLCERGGDGDQLIYWDELLAKRGAFIIYSRIIALEEMEFLVTRIHNRLTHSQEILRFVYQPAYDPLPQPEGQYVLPIQTPIQRSGFSEDEIRQGFIKRLREVRNEEVARGVTTIGPHRDEMRFLSNGIDLGSYGSRGQVRTAIMSIKFAEVEWLREKTGEPPVLLLDEILAELDIQRRADLLAYIDSGEQALLTTTDMQLFSEKFSNEQAIWRVEKGRFKGVKLRYFKKFD